MATMIETSVGQQNEYTKLQTEVLFQIIWNIVGLNRKD